MAPEKFGPPDRALARPPRIPAIELRIWAGAKNGAIISLTLPEKNVSQAELQARNRITSALSKLNIFVEAGIKSGTMWQYNFSKKQNKLIATVRPSDLQREQSRLPQLVIKEGGLVFDTNLSNFKEILSLIEKENNAKIDDFIKISPTNSSEDI